MRLLIITHGYAPALNARAFRWTALAEHFAAAGHDVEVITVRSAGGARTETVNGVRIHRVGMYLEKLGIAARQAGHGVENSRQGSARGTVPSGRTLMRIAKKIHDLTWKRIYWPDYAVPWIPFALIACRKAVARARPTAVISVSLPFSSHVSALLAGVSRKKIPWIVDVGDPFFLATETPVNNHALYRSANKRAEAAVVRGSQAVTVTTPATALAYASAFGCPEKITVIPPLLSMPVAPSGQGGERILFPDRLVCIGTLNRKIRNPDRLLAIFEAMMSAGLAGDIQLHFYGETGDCAESFRGLSNELTARVHVHGLVPRTTAAEAMRTALALVNIGNATTLQLPSKLVEYVASTRPIINLATGANDSSAEFLRGIAGVLNLTSETTVAANARAVAEFLGSAGQFDPPRDASKWLAAFSLDAIALQYETVITRARSFV